jgi:hypothetical protein
MFPAAAASFTFVSISVSCDVFVDVLPTKMPPLADVPPWFNSQFLKTCAVPAAR